MTIEERARILRMLADGKITAEEAGRLLDAIEPSREEGRLAPSPNFARQPSEISTRSLVIAIKADGDNKVNVRIPLGLARAAGRFIPRQAEEYLDRYDINIRELLSNFGASLAPGPLLEIKDDEDEVRIAVE